MVKFQLAWNKEKITELWQWQIIFWLNIFGWWAEEAPTPFWRKWLTRLRFILLIDVFFHVLGMVTAIFIKFSQGDIMENLFCVFGAGPGFVGLHKMIVCIRYRKTLKEAMDLLDVMISEIDEPELVPIVRSGMKRCWIAFTLCLGLGSCITLHWLSRPFLLAVFNGEKTRILDSWPVFNDTWTQWFLTYLYQGLNVCICGHAFYIFDNVYFCISESLLCQFEVLKYRLTHLRLDGSTQADGIIKKCIKQHTQILKVCDKLREASEGVIIFQCINTVIMLCTGIFIITIMVGINMNIMLNLGEITLVIIVILFFYCWYSNEITYQCANLVTSGYMVDWTDGTLSQKKNLHNLMTMAMQPVVFGGITEIDLNTFINVLKTAYSYYTVLIAAGGAGENTQ